MVLSALYIISHRPYHHQQHHNHQQHHQQRYLWPQAYNKPEKIKDITTFYKDYCLSNVY